MAVGAHPIFEPCRWMHKLSWRALLRTVRPGTLSRDMPDSPNRYTERGVPPCGCAEPGLAGAATCYCGVEDLLRIIRRRYSLAVMNAIHMRGQARYQEIAVALPAMSSSTLAETLHALETARLAVRQPNSDDRPFLTYSLTDSGAKLLARLRDLLAEL